MTDTDEETAVKLGEIILVKAIMELKWGIGNPWVGDLSYFKDTEAAKNSMAKVRAFNSIFEYRDEKSKPAENGTGLANVLRVAKRAEVTGIANCGECSDLVVSYLYRSGVVGQIKKLLHPNTEDEESHSIPPKNRVYNEDNHVLVSFKVGEAEYVIDVWAYIATRKIEPNEAGMSRRRTFGLHKLEDHMKVAQDLYAFWSGGKEKAPPYVEIFSTEAVGSQGLYDHFTIGTMPDQVTENLHELGEEIEREINQVLTDNGDQVSNPRSSIMKEEEPMPTVEQLTKATSE